MLFQMNVVGSARALFLKMLQFCASRVGISGCELLSDNGGIGERNGKGGKGKGNRGGKWRFAFRADDGTLKSGASQ